jgi:hypothetical protein
MDYLCLQVRVEPCGPVLTLTLTLTLTLMPAGQPEADRRALAGVLVERNARCWLIYGVPVPPTYRRVESRE